MSVAFKSIQDLTELRKVMSCVDTLDAADTAELVGSGNTFAEAVRAIMVSYVSKATYIAKTAVAAAAAADGSLDDRIYLPEGSEGIVIPWSGRDVYFLNAVAAETPIIFVLGLAPEVA